jgi:hypothetical protein
VPEGPTTQGTLPAKAVLHLQVHFLLPRLKWRNSARERFTVGRAAEAIAPARGDDRDAGSPFVAGDDYVLGELDDVLARIFGADGCGEAFVPSNRVVIGKGVTRVDSDDMFGLVGLEEVDRCIQLRVFAVDGFQPSPGYGADGDELLSILRVEAGQRVEADAAEIGGERVGLPDREALRAEHAVEGELGSDRAEPGSLHDAADQLAQAVAGSLRLPRQIDWRYDRDKRFAQLRLGAQTTFGEDVEPEVTKALGIDDLDGAATF